MIYTVRYAHLKNKPDISIGTIIRKGDAIGIMGSTGQSTGAHLHIDCANDNINWCWRQSDAFVNVIPNTKELNYFIDEDLFNRDYKITTWICDYRYQNKYKKVHWGYDLHPESTTLPVVYWNRSYTGEVIKVDFDNGYGNYIMIKYEK